MIKSKLFQKTHFLVHTEIRGLKHYCFPNHQKYSKNFVCVYLYTQKIEPSDWYFTFRLYLWQAILNIQHEGKNKPIQMYSHVNCLYSLQKHFTYVKMYTIRFVNFFISIQWVVWNFHSRSSGLQRDYIKTSEDILNWKYSAFVL